MARQPSVYVVSQLGYFRPFSQMFRFSCTPHGADIFMFTGGSDISPNLYGEEEGQHTYTNPERDKMELFYYDMAIRKKKKMLGICRGAQLFTALNGGKLVQHINHPGYHYMITNRGDEVGVISMHHQMMNPFGLPKANYDLLGWSDNLSDVYLNGEEDQIPEMWKHRHTEPEAIWFPKTQCLGIQSHPESMPEKSAGLAQFRAWAKEFLY